MASPAFPEPPSPIPATSFADAEAAIERLHANKARWVSLDIPARIALLERCIEGLLAQAQGWVETACKAKGIAMDSPLAGEEWLGGPAVTMRNIRLFILALKAGGQPQLPGVSTRPDGQQVARVFPANWKESVMFTGYTGDVWIEPGHTATQGQLYRDKAQGKAGSGGVGLVLSAGNVAAIGPTDALYKLIVEDEVVLLKTNPVNAYVGPYIEKAFQCLVDEGFFAVVHGGAEIGGFLCNHPKVDTVHITGSDRTHDAIVWGGTPEEQARRKAARQPVLTKPITSELGCVTPVLVTPGQWTEAELEFQARQVAGMVTNNASFNCNAAKVIVLASGWAQKEDFLRRLKAWLAKAPARKAYYPGAIQRYEAFLKNYPKAERLGEVSADVVPWTVLPDVPARDGEYALSNEAFCGVLAITTLEATDAVSFLDRAVTFANDTCWGTLSCILLVDERVQKAHPVEVDRAIASLRYGGIGVNCWPGVIFGLVSTTWGAFPGHPLEDIRSGRGVVHNAFLLDHPQKSVVKAPFRYAPPPVWSVGHRTLSDLGRTLMQFESNGGLLDMFPVIWAALRA